jgi:hypothetical protein
MLLSIQFSVPKKGQGDSPIKNQRHVSEHFLLIDQNVSRHGRLFRLICKKKHIRAYIIYKSHSALDTNLIASCLGDVSHPSICVVTRLIVDAEETNVNSASCEHGYLKLYIDWWSTPSLGPGRRHQIDISRKHTLRLSGEALHPPNDGLLLGLVLGPSERVLNLCLGSILRNGDLDHNVRRKQLIGKVGNDLEIDRYPRVALLLLNGRDNSKGKIDVVVDTIPHQLKLPVGGDECNGPIGIELAQPDAPMEGAVVDLYPRLPHVTALLLNNELVVETKLALRHPREFGVHLHLTRDLIAQDLTRRGEEKIDTLQHIDVHLILLVADALPPPVDGAGNLTGELRRFRLVLRPDVAQVDVQAQDVDGAVLRVSKVHRLVHQLVDERHVVPHGVLIELLAKVGLEDADLLEQILKDQGRVDVGPGEGDEVHVEVARVEEGAVLDALDRGLRSSLLCGNYLLFRIGVDDERPLFLCCRMEFGGFGCRKWFEWLG